MIQSFKRLLFIIGFIPVMFISCLKWIFLGSENSLDLLERFEDWTDNKTNL